MKIEYRLRRMESEKFHWKQRSTGRYFGASYFCLKAHALSSFASRDDFRTAEWVRQYTKLNLF